MKKAKSRRGGKAKKEDEAVEAPVVAQTEAPAAEPETPAEDENPTETAE